MELSLQERVYTRARGYVRTILGRQLVRNDGLLICSDPQFVQDPVLLESIRLDRHERAEVALVKATLRPTDKVLEIGAGFGMVTMTCARICGSGNVMSFEANENMFALLKKNLDLNGLPANVNQQVISLDGGEVTFSDSGSMVGSSLYVREGTSTRTVQSVSLRDLVATREPTFLVMDIEGSEIDILGMFDAPSVRAIAVEVHPHIVGDSAIADMEDRLTAQGFKRVKVIEDERRRFYERTSGV